jgi:hypothetical protein
MNRALLLCPLLAACAPEEGVLVLEPASIEWVDLVNEGSRDLEIRVLGYDRERLCLEGYEHEEGAFDLPTLSPGSRAVLLVGVCGYLTGDTWSEIGSEVRGRIQLLNDGADPVEMLEYSFTPVRDQGGDTGS